MNALSQTTLKLMAPGNPDIYQGTELWDFSLVDPDNRRPVDFESRKRFVSQLEIRGEDLAALCSELLDNYQDGRIKMWVTMRGLSLRRELHNLFHRGSYLPLATTDENRHLCAFARSYEEHGRREVVVVAVPRFAYSLMGGKMVPPLRDVWGDGLISLPPDMPDQFENIFTGERVGATDGKLNCRELFASFPACVLKVVG